MDDNIRKILEFREWLRANSAELGAFEQTRSSGKRHAGMLVIDMALANLALDCGATLDDVYPPVQLTDEDRAEAREASARG